jgi:hypothetical protein
MLLEKSNVVAEWRTKLSGPRALQDIRQAIPNAIKKTNPKSWSNKA